MPNYKINRTEEDVMRELTAILRELKDPRIDPMLTIVRVELSRDLSECKIYVSCLSGKQAAKESCKGLDSAAGFIRRELLHRLKIRKSPILRFIADDSIAHSAEINRKLKSLLPDETETDEIADTDTKKE